MRHLVDEFKKLAHLSNLAVAIGWILCVAALVIIHISSADAQYAIAITSYNAVAHPESQEQLCDFLGEPIGPRCDAAQNEEIEFAQRFLDETRDLYPLASASLDPVGSGGIVAGFMASLIGVLVVAGIAGAHVGGEWGRGTVRQALSVDPRRPRFFVFKVLSVWAFGAGLLLASWLALVIASPFLRDRYEVPPAPPGADFATFTAQQILRALVVIGVVAILGTAVAVFVRGSIGTLGVTAGIIIASFIATASDSTFKLSPAYWVAAWMRFEPTTLWRDHLWVDRFPLVDPIEGFVPNQWAGLRGLVAFAAITAVIGGLRLIRGDV
jgi:hypothetical protein